MFAIKTLRTFAFSLSAAAAFAGSAMAQSKDKPKSGSGGGLPSPGAGNPKPKPPLNGVGVKPPATTSPTGPTKRPAGGFLDGIRPGGIYDPRDIRDPKTPKPPKTPSFPDSIFDPITPPKDGGGVKPPVKPPVNNPPVKDPPKDNPPTKNPPTKPPVIDPGNGDGKPPKHDPHGDRPWVKRPKHGHDVVYCKTPINYDYCRQYGMKKSFGYCYQGFNHSHWYCNKWSDVHGCWFYFDQSCSSWYYWCEQDSCYYPSSHRPYRSFTATGAVGGQMMQPGSSAPMQLPPLPGQ